MTAGRCRVCGKYELMPFTCRFCGGRFCTEHRLPENHDCLGLAEYKKQMRSEGRLYENVQDYTGAAVQKSVGSAAGWLKFASNNSALTILVIIGIVFILELIPVFGNIIFNTLMLYPPAVAQRPWTLITYMFVHGGIAHLFFNGLFLFFFGPELERRIGTPRFLFVFFASGILAALGHMLTSSVPIVGASGALYGVFAALAILAPHIRIYLFFIPMQITYALVFFALVDFSMLRVDDNIAHIAHLSGLVVGLAMGYQLKKAQQKQETRRY